MRQITKDIQSMIDGSPQGFRLTKPDAFSGVEILRLLLRLQDQRPDENPSVLDLITSLSADELRSVMTSCLNHVSVLLPAGPNPVMTGSEWGYPELKHDTVSCMKLVLEEITWALEGFFGDGGPDSLPPNIDGFLFLPVAAGMWKQHELWDGTYTLDDLLDIAELAEVRRENKYRAMEMKEHG